MHSLMLAVDDLLRMVSGIDWNEQTGFSNGSEGNPVPQAGQMLFEAFDGAAFVGALPQNSTPGRYYNYSTGNYQLLQYNLRCCCCAFPICSAAVAAHLFCGSMFFWVGGGPWPCMPCGILDGGFLGARQSAAQA
jgi:hypothetical protein